MTTAFNVCNLCWGPLISRGEFNIFDHVVCTLPSGREFCVCLCTDHVATNSLTEQTIYSSGEVLEEAAHRWVVLQTHLKCDKMDLSSLPFVKERKATMDDLNSSLLKKTATLFGRALDDSDVPTLR